MCDNAWCRDQFQIRENDFLTFDAMRHAAQCIGRPAHSFIYRVVDLDLDLDLDLDPHYFGSWIRIYVRVKSWIRFYINVQIQELYRLEM